MAQKNELKLTNVTSYGIKLMKYQVILHYRGI